MSFSLTVLGSSGALPIFGRFPSAHYLQVQNHHILIDCGEGTQMQMTRFQVPALKIDHILISHLHGDHYLGLTGLLFSMHLHHRKKPVHIYSQRGLDEILLAQLKYANSTLGFAVHFHVLKSDEPVTVFEDDVLSIETIPLKHKIACNGFLVREKPKPRRINKEKLTAGIQLQHIARLKEGQDILDDAGNILYKNEDYTLAPRKSLSYAYCSDTTYYEKITDQIKHVDMLYHEATFMETEQGKARETLHSTAREAATIASMAQVGKLIIGHFSGRYRELEPLLREAQSIFPKTTLAIEGETIELES